MTGDDSLFFEDIPLLKECPNLQAILKRDSMIQKVESVYPAMTYAAHATMLTGRYQDEHGINHNEKVQVDNPHSGWNWRRKVLLQLPTPRGGNPSAAR
jgi:predicted AlkP superfamily pyrophosphatase or phosphodiesterase